MYGRGYAPVVAYHASVKPSGSIHPVEAAYAVDEEVVNAYDIIKLTREGRQ